MRLNQQITHSGGENDFMVELIDKYLFASDEYTKVSTFFQVYKPVIYECILKAKNESVTRYILNKININFNRSVNLLIHLIDFLINNGPKRKIYSQRFCKCLYKNWNLFEPYWQNTAQSERQKKNDDGNKVLLVSLLTKLLLLEPYMSLLKDDTASITNLFAMYTYLLNCPDTNMSFKCKLLDLLYFFCSDSVKMSIRPCLEKFVQLYFPLRCSELDRSDASFTYYTNSISKLLVSLDLTRSPDLLQIILNIYTRESKHVCDAEIESSLVRFIKRIDNATQDDILNTCMDQWLTANLNTVNDHERKSILYKKVLYLFLSFSDKQTLINCVCKNLHSLVKLLEKELNNIQVTSRFKFSDQTLKNSRIIFCCSS
jgi:hypothetical protein